MYDSSAAADLLFCTSVIIDNQNKNHKLYFIAVLFPPLQWDEKNSRFTIRIINYRRRTIL